MRRVEERSLPGRGDAPSIIIMLTEGGSRLLRRVGCVGESCTEGLPWLPKAKVAARLRPFLSFF